MAIFFSELLRKQAEWDINVYNPINVKISPEKHLSLYRKCNYFRDGRFGSKVGQIGPKLDNSGAFSDQISVHYGADWPQMGQIRDFFRTDFSTFWRNKMC